MADKRTVCYALSYSSVEEVMTEHRVAERSLCHASDGYEQGVRKLL